jgi:hypothetical protein
VGVIVDMTDGVAVWNCPGIECPVVPQGRQPLSFLGTMCRAEDQELSERRAVPSRNMASNSALAIASRSGVSRLGHQYVGMSCVCRGLIPLDR